MEDEPARPERDAIENPEAYVIERMQAGADEEAIVAGLEERGMRRAEPATSSTRSIRN